MVGEAGQDNATAGAPQEARAEHRIAIAAPAEAVWAILSDLEGWASWNPIYAPPVCVPRVGETISSAVTMPGGGSSPFTAEICAWEPNRRFGWYAAVMDGQMTMTRTMEIEPTGEGACMFINGESFGGAMGPAIMGDKTAAIADGFRVMNEALKKAAEAR